MKNKFKLDNFVDRIIFTSLDTPDIRYIIYFVENDYRSPYLELNIRFEKRYIDSYGLYQYEEIDFDSYSESLKKLYEEMIEIDLSCVDKNFNFHTPLYKNESFNKILIDNGVIKIK